MNASKIEKKIEKLNKRIVRAERFRRFRKSEKLKREIVKLEIKLEKYLVKAQNSSYTVRHAKKFKYMRISTKIIPLLGVVFYLYFFIFNKLVAQEPETFTIFKEFSYGTFQSGLIAAAIALTMIPLVYTWKKFRAYIKSAKDKIDNADNQGTPNFKYDPNVSLFWTFLFGGWVFVFIYLINRFMFKAYKTLTDFITSIQEYIVEHGNAVSASFKSFADEFTSDFYSMFERGIIYLAIAYITWFILDSIVVRVHENKKRKHNIMKQYAEKIESRETHETLEIIKEFKEKQEEE